MFPGLFLDRDGVIIENQDSYVRSWTDVIFYPQALLALKEFSQHSCKIVIVTNQSVVGRGHLSLDQANEINRRLVEVIRESGGRVDGIYLCPHAPEANCNCRKPSPGLLLQAARELSIDLGRSAMIGDALSDIQAGKATGIPHNILVRTGRGAAQSLAPEAASLQPFRTFETLADALTYLSRHLFSDNHR